MEEVHKKGFAHVSMWLSLTNTRCIILTLRKWDSSLTFASAYLFKLWSEDDIVEVPLSSLCSKNDAATGDKGTRVFSGGRALFKQPLKTIMSVFNRHFALLRVKIVRLLFSIQP